jgi:hypothetical protein
MGCLTSYREAPASRRAFRFKDHSKGYWDSLRGLPPPWVFRFEASFLK